MIAAQQGNMEMVSLLLEYGAALEATNENSYTPLSHAIQTSRMAMVEMLVDSGANVHHEIKTRMNQFDLARIRGNQAVIAVLKKKGAKATPSAFCSHARRSISSARFTETTPAVRSP